MAESAEARHEMDVRELLARHAAIGGWEVLEPEKLVYRWVADGGRFWIWTASESVDGCVRAKKIENT